MTHAFWPGLALAAMALLVWWGAYGYEWIASIRWAEECSRRGICADCEESLSRCTCFDDKGIL